MGLVESRISLVSPDKVDPNDMFDFLLSASDAGYLLGTLLEALEADQHHSSIVSVDNINSILVSPDVPTLRGQRRSDDEIFDEIWHDESDTTESSISYSADVL